MEDGSQPEGYPIKGNTDSMIYHKLDSRSYGRTTPGVWFATPAAAEAAGFTEAADEDNEPYGPGSYIPLADGSQPEGYPIKGNTNSMVYHHPDSRTYGNFTAEVWFASAAAAEVAGFREAQDESEAAGAAMAGAAVGAGAAAAAAGGGGGAPPGGDPTDTSGGFMRFLPWILLAILGVVIIGALIYNQDDDEGDATAATTTTVAATTTTAAPATTTTVAETTTTEEMVALDPIALKLGSILPQTGALASIIEALEQPIRMGVEEINAVSAGLVEVAYRDTGTDAAIASTNVDEFLTGEFNGIIGPAATSVTLGIFDKVNESQITMCSGSNTGAALSASVYDPYYNRTAPSDNIQAPTLGDLVLGDGHGSVAVVWRADEYGQGFGETLAAYLSDSGADVPLQEGYDFNATSFTDVAAAIVASGGEAVVMITFDEGAQLLTDLKGAGYEGQIYVADGFKDNVTADTLGGPELLVGIRGTAPSSSPANGEPTFPDRLEAFAPGTPTIFSSHFYDCLIVTVLAAQEAQSSDPTVFVDHMISVTKDGTKCTSFADCFALVLAGEDIDYDGASGPLDFGDNGEPTIGTYDLYEYDADGAAVSFDQKVGEV
jgi:branched-chain amino acid transport system substrate-binding protein